VTTLAQQIQQSPGFYLAGSIAVALACLLFIYAGVLAAVGGGVW